MEEVQFLNTKEFTYHIEIDDVITKIYDEKIKEILNKINSIKEDIDLHKKLVTLSDMEMKIAKDKDDYNTLVRDKEYFINVYIKYKYMLVSFGTVLNKLYYKKKQLNALVENINYYNDSIGSINKIIKQYNYDIIYNEKNIDDFSILSSIKNKLYNIIYFDYSYINANVDIIKLKKEYNSLSNIESYYNTEYKSNKLTVDDDYKASDCNDYIFINNENKSNDYSSNNAIGDLDYIAYCDELSGKKRIRRKIKKIKESSKWNKIKNLIKKNIGKVIAGVLVGATILGASTVTAGFDLKNSNDDFNTKNVSTIDSVSLNEKITKIEDSTIDTKKTKINSKQHINNTSVKEEITIGTKVSASSDIYINATDAYNKENSLTPYYPISDEREVSLIYYKNNDGNTVLISEDNKEKILELKQLKYDVVAYCLDNVTHNIGEGWYNKDDVKVLVK